MKYLRTLLSLAAVLALPAVGLGPRLSADDFDSADLYKKVVDSALFIVTPMPGGMAMGSGSLIDKEKRYVLTNYHVVEENEMVYCQFPVHQKDGTLLTDKKAYIERIPAGQALKAKVLFRDKTRDLAIIQLEKLTATARQIKLAKTSADVGSTTWNIGSPGAVSQVFSITEGKVRAVGMEDFVAVGGDEALRIKCRMVTATNPTNPGDSGGPLVNKHGEQVAVTESGRRDVQQVNKFVDVSEVRAFLKEKKIVLHDDGPEEKPGPKPKVGPDSIKPKIDGPPVKTPSPATPAPKVDEGGTPAPSEADEKAAAAMLARANLFAEGDENRPTYIGKLNEIVKKYPGTQAAKDAEKKLKALK